MKNKKDNNGVETNGKKKLSRFFQTKRSITSQDYFRPQRWGWTALYHSLDKKITRHSRGSLTVKAVEKLRFFWLDGIFATISDNIYLNFLVLFALAYGATKGQIGLITALGNLFGAAALFPGARLAERVKSRKRLVVTTGGGIGRLALLLLVLFPFLSPTPTAAIVLIIVLNSLRSFMGSFASPAWTAIVDDITPRNIRGRYFSKRSVAMSIAALAVAPLAGVLIRNLNGALNLPLFGFQIVFFVAFFTGLFSTYFFNKIQEDQQSTNTIKSTAKEFIKSITISREYFGFLLSAFIWNLFIQSAAPFFSVYLVTSLGGTVSHVGIMAGITSGATLLGQFIFGRPLEKKGDLWVQRMTGLLIPILPLGWTVISMPEHAYILSAFGGIVWAGYNLSNFNILLSITPNDNKPKAVALYQTIVFSSAVIGPLLGGYFASQFGFKAVFSVSTLGRFIGIILFLLFVRSNFTNTKG